MFGFVHRFSNLQTNHPRFDIGLVQFESKQRKNPNQLFGLVCRFRQSDKHPYRWYTIWGATHNFPFHYNHVLQIFIFYANKNLNIIIN